MLQKLLPSTYNASIKPELVTILCVHSNSRTLLTSLFKLALHLQAGITACSLLTL